MKKKFTPGLIAALIITVVTSWLLYRLGVAALNPTFERRAEQESKNSDTSNEYKVAQSSEAVILGKTNNGWKKYNLGEFIQLQVPASWEIEDFSDVPNLEQIGQIDQGWRWTTPDSNQQMYIVLVNNKSEDFAEFYSNCQRQGNHFCRSIDSTEYDFVELTMLATAEQSNAYLTQLEETFLLITTHKVNFETQTRILQTVRSI